MRPGQYVLSPHLEPLRFDVPLAVTYTSPAPADREVLGVRVEFEVVEE